MNKQEAIFKHRSMWDWLSRHPEKDKSDFMNAFSISPQPTEDCFLCQYATENRPWDCKRDCLLLWPGGESCQRGEALFNKWSQATDSLRAKLARQIRDLPEREEKVMQEIRDALEVDVNVLRESMERTMRGVGIEPGKIIKVSPPKLTRAEAIAKTREQWKWLAHNPNKEKNDYFKMIGVSFEDTPMHFCYLCEYIREQEDCDVPKCGEECPLKWPGGCCSFYDDNGLFNMWADTTNQELRTSIAWLISRLPEKEET
jgi:hypothetical protein